MINFELLVASLGQAEDDTLEYALLVRRRCDHANRYTHVYSGHRDDLPNFVLDFLENRKRSTEVGVQCQQEDNDTPFDEDLIKVEADVISARGTVSETRMEIVIDEIVGRDWSANCRVDDGPKQQPEQYWCRDFYTHFEKRMIFVSNTVCSDFCICRVPITIHDRVKRRDKNKTIKPYSYDSSCKTVEQEKSVVHCVKTPMKHVIVNVDGIGRVHACKECGACYGRLSLLEKHMKSRHTITEHWCNICDKYFYDAQSLIRHISAIHHGEKPFQCPTCDKHFNRKHHLNANIRSIHERHEFVCEKCCKIFNSIGNLMNDALIQSGEKSYICKICGKRFTQSSNLTQHVLIHSGEKPYNCEICGKRFTDSSNLFVHRHCHLNIKPHQCPVCDMRFVATHEVKQHVNLLHPTRW